MHAHASDYLHAVQKSAGEYLGFLRGAGFDVRTLLNLVASR
jgi:hypothetical protein